MSDSSSLSERSGAAVFKVAFDAMAIVWMLSFGL